MATVIEMNIWRPIYFQLVFVIFGAAISYLAISLFACVVLVTSYLLSISFVIFAFSSRFQAYILRINGLRKTSFGQNSQKNYRFIPASSDPWKGLLIPREVDNELEEFFEKTFEKYIYTWYSNVSNDNSFLYELKSGSRYLVAVLLRRFQKIDLTDVILSKMLSCAVGHLDCFIKAKKLGKASTARNLEDLVFEDYNGNLHVAVYSRKSELEYLNSLSECILPYILSKQHMRNKSVGHLAREILSNSVLLPIMDAIADPDVINHLLQLLFDKDSMVIYPQTNFDYVPILDRFVSASSPPNASVKHNIGSNLTEFYCLYPFMKFLKDEGAVSVLQFCLAIDEFNKTLLNPDISEKEIMELHVSANKIHETYMRPDGIDRLDFDPVAVEEFKQIIEGPPADVLRLQTKESLYKMYEYAFDLLEKKYLPLFYQSEAHFEYLCGQRNTSQNAKNSTKLSKKKSDFTGKLGEKLMRLRGVFQPATTVEGRLEAVAEADLTDAVFEAEEMKFGTEDLDSAYGDIDDLGLRDLSAWRVSIPKVIEKNDEQGRPSLYYVIDVQRIDVTNKDVTDRFHWVVERQYHEFYVLESKLTEFHGELVGIHLPSKKSFGSKRYEYLESRRAAFEEFLQRLLQRATFRSSELLFNFLSSTGDFTIGFLPDLNIGKIIKTVPSILVKERGQHIETFLQAFVTAGESFKAKSSKVEFKDISVQTPAGTLKQQKSLYKDNAGRKAWRSSVEDAKHLEHVPHLQANNVCDYLIYLGLKVFAAPRWLLQMAIALQKMFGPLFETMVAVYLDKSLEQAFVPQRIVNLIRIVRDIIYTRGVVPMRSHQQRLQRARETLDMMKKYLPKPIVSLIGHENHDIGIWYLLECLQHPRLNKQLAYVLLDVVAKELFPELMTDEQHERTDE